MELKKGTAFMVTAGIYALGAILNAIAENFYIAAGLGVCAGIAAYAGMGGFSGRTGASRAGSRGR